MVLASDDRPRHGAVPLVRLTTSLRRSHVTDCSWLLSAQVTLQCGEAQTVVSVSEPRTCEYLWTVTLPEACSYEAMSMPEGSEAAPSDAASATPAASTSESTTTTGASDHPAGRLACLWHFLELHSANQESCMSSQTSWMLWPVAPQLLDSS